jgi:hypothetical protein
MHARWRSPPAPRASPTLSRPPPEPGCPGTEEQREGASESPGAPTCEKLDATLR